MAKSQTIAHTHGTFWGVISYVPIDLAWCEWLYFTLNGYPVPVALSGHMTHDGFVLPEALTVFPDPDDADDAASYQEVLKSGRYLIVICSPNSAHCQKVDEHIREFKKNGGDERIIVMVVEGEPNSARREPTNGAWLPPWLRWRLDSSGTFQPADRSEPRIIDARPGRATLDEIMGTLIATLLDIPRTEFEIVSGPEPQAPSPLNEGLVEQEGMVDQIWAELAPHSHHAAAHPSAQPAAVSLPSTHPSAHQAAVAPHKSGPSIGKLVAAGIFVVAIGAGAYLGLSSGKRNQTTAPVAQSHSATPAPALPPGPAHPPPPSPIVDAATTRPAPVAPPIAKTEPEPTASSEPAPPTVSAPPVVAPSSSPEPIAQVAPAPAPRVTVAPAPAPAPVPEGTGQLAPPPIALASTSPPPAPAASTSTLPAAPAPAEDSTIPPATLTPEQITEQAAAAILKEATDKRNEADRLVRTGHVSEALPLYLRALDCTERYTALRAGDSAAELDMAKLCLIVGSLQSSYDSTAEARQTLQAGRKILGKAKGKGSDERGRVMNALQEQIKRLDDDAPRRRAAQN